MNSNREDRITKLSKRFKSHTGGRPAETDRSRERRSFYLDVALVEKLDQVYRDINHELYPHRVSKSMFLEAILEHGLDNLQTIKDILSRGAKKEDNS
jgi:hypothetical protein